MDMLLTIQMCTCVVQCIYLVYLFKNVKHIMPFKVNFARQSLTTQFFRVRVSEYTDRTTDFFSKAFIYLYDLNLTLLIQVPIKNYIMHHVACCDYCN